MDCLILAGGKGSRLKPVLKDRPKPMAEINGKPFLSHLMNHWIEQGISSFTISICYMASFIENFYGPFFNETPLEYIQEPHALGTGGALIFYANQTVNLPKNLLVLNGDTFFKASLSNLTAFHENSGNLITISTTEFTNYGSRIQRQSDGTVKSFFESESPEFYTNSINAGATVISNEYLLSLKNMKPASLSLENDLFENYLKNNGKISIYDQDSKSEFLDIGTPDNLEKAKLTLK